MIGVLKKPLLDFVELKDAHEGQNMATAVSTALNELELQNKLVALVIDNVSSNDTLVRRLSTQLERSSPLSRWDQDKGRIRCLSHIIHLAVMASLKGVRAVPPSTDIRAFDPSDQFLIFEDTESFVSEKNNEAAELDSSTTIDPMVNLSSAVDKMGLNYLLCQSAYLCANALETYRFEKSQKLCDPSRSEWRCFS